MLKIAETFLGEAASVFDRVPIRETQKLMTEFASEHYIEIPYPVGTTTGVIPDKSKIFLSNLKAFTEQQKFLLLDKFSQIDHPVQTIKNKRIKFREKLYEVYFELLENSRHDIYGKITKEVKDVLSNYPKALEAYKKASDMFYRYSMPRECLDNLRFCIETLIKEILNSTSSWDSLMNEFGKYIKDEKMTSQFRKTFFTILNLYRAYQDKDVKHNDNIISSEIEFIFELSSVYIRHFVRLHILSSKEYL